MRMQRLKTGSVAFGTSLILAGCVSLPEVERADEDASVADVETDVGDTGNGDTGSGDADSGDTGELNACGGTRALSTELGGECEGEGEWVCGETSESDMRCQNACEGFTVLEGQPGDACSACGEYECDDTGTVVCTGPAPNACGGCAALPHAVGTDVGCDTDACETWQCGDGDDVVTCQGDCECTSHASQACNSGDVYWFDSCGAREEVAATCTDVEVCSDGACICVTQTTQQCDDGDVYYYDSCGVRGEVAVDCIDGQVCTGAECACELEASQACDGDHIYFYDSCGNQGEVAIACPDGAVCADNTCVCEANTDLVCVGDVVYHYDACGVQGEVADICLGGAVCTDGACICEANVSQACDDNDVYYYDACGERGDLLHACVDGEVCDAGECVCEVNASQACDGGDLHYFDSCGVVGDVLEGCGGWGCSEGACTPDGFVRIAAGSFQMGSPDTDPNRVWDEPLHNTTLTNDFYLMEKEVTQADWGDVIGSADNPSINRGATLPVETVTWWEAAAYTNALSRAQGLAECYTLVDCSRLPGHNMVCDGVVVSGGATVYDCEGYRLPTEAEWEYAARAGTVTVFHNGNDVTEVGAIAWYSGSSESGPQAAGTLAPNAWGLHDMSGNVMEWCWDFYGNYGVDATDPVGPSMGEHRVLRGGAWNHEAPRLRSASRLLGGPGVRNEQIGFRVARTVH